MKLSLPKLGLKEICNFHFLGTQTSYCETSKSHRKRPELPANSQHQERVKWVRHLGCFNPIKLLSDHSSRLTPCVEKSLPAELNEPKLLGNNKWQLFKSPSIWVVCYASNHCITLLDHLRDQAEISSCLTQKCQGSYDGVEKNTFQDTMA